MNDALTETLARFLWQDILTAQAERKLPAPPISPSFARETQRPGKAS
jgi:hypothetical protein